MKENSLNANSNISLTNDQIEKLKLFSDQKINNSYLIQEVTFILSNEMLKEFRSNKIGFLERFSTNFLFAFVLSVINNHILLIQRKQILRQQILKQNEALLIDAKQANSV